MVNKGHSMDTMINGCVAEWDEHIYSFWDKNVLPLFGEDEWCMSANYFTPRPYVDEYNRGSNEFGFTYTLMPGYRVCQVKWRLSDES